MILYTYKGRGLGRGGWLSTLDSRLVDDGKRLDALDVALRCNIIYKGEGV